MCDGIMYVGSQALGELETESSRGMKWPKIRKIVEWALHELRLANKE